MGGDSGSVWVSVALATVGGGVTTIDDASAFSDSTTELVRVKSYDVSDLTLNSLAYDYPFLTAYPYGESRISLSMRYGTKS